MEVERREWKFDGVDGEGVLAYALWTFYKEPPWRMIGGGRRWVQNPVKAPEVTERVVVPMRVSTGAWKTHQRLFRNTIQPLAGTRWVHQELKRQDTLRYEDRMSFQQKSWSETLPEEVVAFFREVFEAWSEELDYMDNTRVAWVHKASQRRRYGKQRANGCCGSRDRVMKGPDGRTYWVGCNYGH